MIFHSCAISSVCWPMDRPVRGSPTAGGCGASSDGEKPLNTFSLSMNGFCWPSLTRRCANFFETTIGASEVVSEPMAMPLSISPVAILAAMRGRLQAGAAGLQHGDAGRGRRELGAEHASRARFQSFECETTAPPTTSSMCTPFSLYLSTRPFSAPSASRGWTGRRRACWSGRTECARRRSPPRAEGSGHETP